MGILTTDRRGGSTEKDKFSPTSKFIGLIEYDEKNRTMDITFKSGTKTRYLDIYPATFLSFKSSPTLDSFYSRALKGRFQSVKIIDAGIGRNKSTPMNQVKREEPLDRGLRSRIAREERIHGTVSRAFAV